MVSEAFINGHHQVTDETLAQNALIAEKVNASSMTVINAKTTYGLIGDGVANDRAAFMAMFAAINANGGDYYIPSGDYLLSTLGLSLIAGATPKSFNIYTGARVALIRGGSGVGALLTIRGFSHCSLGKLFIDGKNSLFPTGGSHGLVIENCNNFKLDTPVIVDVKNTALLMYSTVVAPSIDGKAIHIDIDGMSGGLPTGNNGALFENFSEGTYIGGRVRNCRGSPGYGFQFKNNCKKTTLSNMIAENCLAGFALGQDTGDGTDYGSYDNIKAIGCRHGVIVGYASYNSFDHVLIDQQAQGFEGLCIQFGSTGNVFNNVMLLNNVTTRASVLFQRNVADGTVPSDTIVNITRMTGGRAQPIEFQLGATNNLVVIQDSDKGNVTATSLVLDNSGNLTNRVVYRNSFYN